MRVEPEGPILIVEDNPGTRTALSTLLNLMGYTTVSVGDAEEALEYLHEGGDVRLIILDLRLPGMDGASFRRVLLADPALADIPIVVYSAHDERPPERVVAFVRKSADPDVLLGVIAKAYNGTDGSRFTST